MVKYKSEESHQKVLDAQKRGIETIKRKALERYYLNPSFCLSCGKLIEVPIGKMPCTIKIKKFCNKSCSAKYNNLKNKIIIYCKNCGKQIINRDASKYCSKDCMREYIHAKNIEIAKTKLSSGTLSDNNARSWFRKISEKKCSICNRITWNGKEIPLIVDHIDGNHNNNKSDNLRMICCNCDAQLPTYKSKNKGNGRPKRRL